MIVARGAEYTGAIGTEIIKFGEIFWVKICSKMFTEVIVDLTFNSTNG